MAISPRNSCASIRAPTCRRAFTPTHATRSMAGRRNAWRGSRSAAGAPAYLYLFDHGYPAMDKAGLHAFHASELPYMFGTLDRTPTLWPKIPATPGERKFSDAMVDYWSSFAKHRPAEVRPTPQPGQPMGRRAPTCISPTLRARRRACSPVCTPCRKQTVCRRKATATSRGT